jgi:hypothetical protein
MEAPPPPPLEVADFLLEFSVILFDPPFGRGDDVLEGRMARQDDQPIANRIRDPHSSSSVCSPSAPSRPRIAAKRPLNSGPLPSRHVATPSGARSARTDSAASWPRHRRARRLSSGGRTGVVARTAAA